MFFLDSVRKEEAISLEEIPGEKELADFYKLVDSPIAMAPMNNDVGTEQQSITNISSIQST